MSLQLPDAALPIAAVDLGSNSLHLVIGRVVGDQLSVLDRMKETLRLAAGLDEQGRLAPDVLDRLLASLAKFRQRLQGIDPAQVRAVGTNTFREAREPLDLIAIASEALGFPIEVLSGAEEARLIYLGVSHDQPRIEGRRLVADIGGGSTECILGKDFAPICKDSLQVGCVSFSRRFFPKGRLTRRAFTAAETAAQLELEAIEARYRRLGWQDCVGSSGTINAVADLLQSSGWTDGTITLDGLRRLRRILTESADIDALELPGLPADRAPVLPGGVAILKALFESLGIEQMRASKAALREGLLWDLLGRIQKEDVRDRTIRALCEGYHVDQEQAKRVERTALRALSNIREAWGLTSPDCSQLLRWAARTHEIGLALAFSGYHKHGAYILTNSDLPGFSRQEQARLAALVRGHRRKLSRQVFADLGHPWSELVMRLCVLLRLAFRLNRTRNAKPQPVIRLRAIPDGLEVIFPRDWLERHPLTRADLEEEDQELSGAGLRLVVLPVAESA